MESTKISSFTDFIQLTEKLDLNSGLHLFRGQAVRRNLLPRVARKAPDIDTTELETKMLAELRRMGAAFLDSSHNSDWELLVIAQHFGLATRLLDWTSNPLAALWFACASHEPDDCFVYSLNSTDLVTSSDQKKGPFDQSKTRIFQPRLNNPRIVAQHGWFTVHRYARTQGKFVKLETNTDVKQRISEIIVPKEQRKLLLKSLDRHGISSRTLFPDLEGLCRYLTWCNEY